MQRIITGDQPLSAEAQSALVLHLRHSLNDPATADDARALLTQLRGRRDLLAQIAEEIDEALGTTHVTVEECDQAHADLAAATDDLAQTQANLATMHDALTRRQADCATPQAARAASAQRYAETASAFEATTAARDQLLTERDTLRDYLSPVIDDCDALPNRLDEPNTGDATWTNSIGMEFRFIQAGRFMMGSRPGHVDEAVTRCGLEREWVAREMPHHEVAISRPYYLGTYAVTQAQWAAVMGRHPSRFTNDPHLPVEWVSWEDVQTFLQKLNAREGETTYRLPTEAEWEYAARAGTTTAYSFGDDPTQLGAHAWYDANSGGKPHPVGQRHPNAWGLYDMHGNVWEWVQDWYGTYPAAAVTDPTGPATGSNRVFRGGGWVISAGYCRSASRGFALPGYRFRNLGLRLVRDLR